MLFSFSVIQLDAPTIPTSLQHMRCASRRNVATFLICRSHTACQFSPVGRNERVVAAGEVSHDAAPSFSTNRLKLPRYFSILHDRLGGSKIERIFNVTSVSSWERGSKETTPDMKPS